MEKGSGTGFGGLSSYATDVDTAIAEADRIASATRPPERQSEVTGSTASEQPVHRDGGAFSSGLKKVGGWALAIGLIVGIKACIYSGVHAVANSGPTDSYSTTGDAGSSGTGANTDVDNSGSLTSTETAAPADATPSQPDEEQIAPGVAEDDADTTSTSKPAAGFGTLTLSELRYCIAEDIRVSAQKTELDGLQYADPEKFNRNVDSFNGAVSDYNSSCSNRMIKSGSRAVATSQVEGQRSSLEAEGRNRVD